MKKAFMTVLFMFLFCPTIFANSYYLGTKTCSDSNLAIKYSLDLDHIFYSVDANTHKIDKESVIVEVMSIFTPQSQLDIMKQYSDLLAQGYSPDKPNLGAITAYNFNLENNTYRIVYAANFDDKYKTSVVVDNSATFLKNSYEQMNDEFLRSLYSNIKYYLILHPDIIKNPGSKGLSKGVDYNATQKI